MLVDFRPGPAAHLTEPQAAQVHRRQQASPGRGHGSIWPGKSLKTRVPGTVPGSCSRGTFNANVIPAATSIRWYPHPVTLACCKVGLDRPLIRTAFVAKLFRSARVSRPLPEPAFEVSGSSRASAADRTLEASAPGHPDRPSITRLSDQGELWLQ